MDSQNDSKKLKDCACLNLRMTSRVITQFFDKALQSAGLRVTQFSILAYISYRERSTVGELADGLLMDQTTVTRTVEILKKNDLIDVEIGADDSRKRYIIITELGRNALNNAIPLWEKVQKHIEDSIGKDRYKELLKTLCDIQKSVND